MTKKKSSETSGVVENPDNLPSNIDDFMFRLTKDEADYTSLRSQIATSNSGRGGTRYLPYAFTELGVAMLSSVLTSETAININRDIMRAFVAFNHLTVRPLPEDNAELRAEIQALRDQMNEILADQNDINETTRAQLDAISSALAELQSLKHSPEAGGQADVGKGGRVREHRPYLGFAVTGYAATYGGYQELVLRMLTGEGYEAVYCEFETVQAFHRGNGVGLALQALAHSPLCAEVIQGIPGGTASVHSAGVAAKDEDLTGV